MATAAHIESVDRAAPAIELKGTTIPVIAVFIGERRAAALAAAIESRLGKKGFFDGEAAVLDFSRQPSDVDDVDDPLVLESLVRALRAHGLQPVAVRSLPAAYVREAEQMGLATVPPVVPPRPALAAVSTAESAPAAIEIVPVDPPEAVKCAASTERESVVLPAEMPSTVTALVVDRPLRSGQRVYAKGRDLVVLAPVNPGAELIADGSIHCYGRLRGRVLAGASGDTSATIIAANFQAELASIAGVYKTFETVPVEVSGKLLIVRLREESGTPRLVLEPLSIN